MNIEKAIQLSIDQEIDDVEKKNIEKAIQLSIVDQEKHIKELLESSNKKKIEFIDDIQLTQTLSGSFKSYKNLYSEKVVQIKKKKNYNKISFNQDNLLKNIISFEDKFYNINTNILNEKIKDFNIIEKYDTDSPKNLSPKTDNHSFKDKAFESITLENINILSSPGDGSCLLHSINQLLFINNYNNCVIVDPEIWRTIISKFIDNYILNNLSFKNLNDYENILLATLNKEKQDLVNPTGWLSATTIIIICTIFDININIIIINTDYNTKNLIRGLNNNNNNNTLNGGLIFTKCHWDCYTNN